MTGPDGDLAGVRGEGTDTADCTVERILDAASELFTAFGVRRTSIDDVARRARLSRNTVFRRLGSKDDLVSSVVHRELRRLIAEVDEVTAAGGDPTDRLARAFALTVIRVRANPMFATAVALRLEDALAIATVGAGDVLGAAGGYVAGVLRTDQERGAIPPDVDVDAVAEVVVRTLHSMVLTPDSPPLRESEGDLHAFAVAGLGPLLRGGGAPEDA